jgi:hypothetical protein
VRRQVRPLSAHARIALQESITTTIVAVLPASHVNLDITAVGVAMTQPCAQRVLIADTGLPRALRARPGFISSLRARPNATPVRQAMPAPQPRDIPPNVPRGRTAWRDSRPVVLAVEALIRPTRGQRTARAALQDMSVQPNHQVCGIYHYCPGYLYSVVIFYFISVVSIIYCAILVTYKGLVSSQRIIKSDCVPPTIFNV